MDIAIAPNARNLQPDSARLELFATPLAVARVPDADALIAGLKPAILARMATHPGLLRSNIGGWHSDAGMPQWGGEAARSLVRHAIAQAHRMTHPEGYEWSEVSWAVQMWANVSGPGASNAIHVHPGNLWAAVFYVDIGDDEAGDDVGGEFYVEDPRYPGAFMHAPGFRLRGADGKPQEWQRDLRPRAGEMMMFPSWLRHGVRPYRGAGQRISIAMNLDPIPPAGRGPR